MKIDRNNYEMWLLDYLEGNLTSEEVQMVLQFLESNPDCTMELDGMEPWILQKEPVVFPEKTSLKKRIPDAKSVPGESDFDLVSIARMEGDLTGEQVTLHEQMIHSDQEKQRAWARMKQARLPVTHVLYPGREKLKRKAGRKGRILWISMISAAAAIALLLFVVNRIQPEPVATPLAVSTGDDISNSPGEGSSGAEGTSESLEESGRSQATRPSRSNRTVTAVPEEGEAAAGAPAPGTTRQQAPDSKAGTPVMFSIQKNPDRPIPERVRAAPLRIASLDTGVPLNRDIKGRVPDGSYDRIVPLDIPPASIHLSSLSITQLAEIDLQEVFESYTEENNLSLWTIANAGIKGINRITGSDISLLASRDPDGEISGIRFKSRLLNISAPVTQPE